MSGDYGKRNEVWMCVLWYNGSSVSGDGSFSLIVWIKIRIYHDNILWIYGRNGLWKKSYIDGFYMGLIAYWRLNNSWRSCLVYKLFSFKHFDYKFNMCQHLLFKLLHKIILCWIQYNLGDNRKRIFSFMICKAWFLVLTMS